LPELVGEKPPPRDLFPGKLVLFDTFDNPQKTDLALGVFNQVRHTIEDGIYVAESQAQTVNPFQIIQHGVGLRNCAFVVRLRATNCQVFASYRGSASQTRADWLQARIYPTGVWQLVWSGFTQGPTGWQFRPETTIKQSLSPEAELAPGQWITLAGRSSGNMYELWINGKLAAWGTMDSLNEDPKAGPGPSTLVLGAQRTAAGPVKLELDHVAVWEGP
jgi:hypothetical protein